MSDRNEQIVRAVKSGMTYREAAAEFGVTRNAVAGICNRAGLKVGPRVSARQRVGRAENFRRWWNSLTEEQKSQNGKRGRAIQLERQRARTAGAPSGL